MFFGKLLPRDTNFFKLFNQHADHIVEAAHAFSKLVPITVISPCAKNSTVR